MSQDDFEQSARIFAFPLYELSRVGVLVSLYGSELPDAPGDEGSPTTRCIAGTLDRDGATDLRSLSHPLTARTLPLTDGRHAYSAHWSKSLTDAVNRGDVSAEELSAEQLEGLLVKDQELTGS